MTLRTTLAAVSFAALVAGCSQKMMTTPEATDSAKGKPIMPETGGDAKGRAEAMATVLAGPARGKRDPKLEPVALFDGPAMPVGVAVSMSGRTFIGVPRWGDPVKNCVNELKDGKLVAFPDEATNAFDAADPKHYDPKDHFVSPQALVFDDTDRLWVLDPGSFNFGPNLLGGPKLWAYDINTGKAVKKIAFPTDVAMKMTALNDVRFDLKRGTEGTAYITDSGVGGIIVVDLATGNSWRHLDGHPSVMPTLGLRPTTEGQPFLMRKKSGEIDGPDFRSDGIALSPDGRTLYYQSVVSRDLYSVPTDLLADAKTDEMKIAAAVKIVATKPSGSDGILCDPTSGKVFTTEFEDNAIRSIDPQTGTATVVTQDERLLWPDTLAYRDGYLYVTSNQLARQPNYHFGQEMRQPPFALFRIKVGGM